mmetsp:Transcript_8364/g.26029  ORF Transcript_8364/g.26029 Transcript_8364/m.26029 type:complete len:280 (+) Transcript_8364:3-842(+)
MGLRGWHLEGSGATPDACGVLLAGRDGRAGGTWLGLRRLPGGACRFATVLNITEHKEPRTASAPSRGTLPVRFLLGPAEQMPGDFAWALHDEPSTEEMAGFSMICADFGGSSGWSARAAFVRNRAGPTEVSVVPILGLGVHALCNDATLKSDWGRVRRGRHLFVEALRAPGPWLRDALFERLLLDKIAPDAVAPKPDSRPSSDPVFVVPHGEGSAAFGTRACTVVTCSHDGEVQVAERCFDAAALGLRRGELAYVSPRSGGADAWLLRPALGAPLQSRL